MTPPIRLRARQRGAFTEVHLLMPHPMETGFRRDEAGQLVPAHHICEVAVSLDGRSVFEASLSIAVSSDPVIAFRVAGARTGQRLRATWTDSRGEVRSGEAAIA
jgi:sulfur-oxidizing protein SoxZ